jgi:phage shock protein A
MEQSKRKSPWATFLRWLGIKSEAANDKMDSAVALETKLNRKIQELVEKRDDITKSDALAKLRGASKEAELRLKEARKKYANADYDAKISYAANSGDDESAMRYIEERQDLENEIDELKVTKVDLEQQEKQIEKDLDLLDKEVAKLKKDLEKLIDENRKAETTAEAYKVMNDIQSITKGLDTSNISREISEKRKLANGTVAEYQRNNKTATADEKIKQQKLKDELAKYKK